MNIKTALDVSQRSVSFRDAEVLLAAVLKKDRAFLHTHPEQELSAAEAKKYAAFLSDREANKPVAHITGEKEFYGRRFLADARALIPRPETEILVEHAVECATTLFKTHTKTSTLPCPVQIAELGTGGGCIAISVALELAMRAIPTTIIASEISGEALAQAQENWKNLSQGVELGNIQLEFIEADMFDHSKFKKRPFDIILANLPYVEDTWRVNPIAQKDVVFYEPEVALFGGPDGLNLYRRFFSEAPEHLTEKGIIFIEYGETQTKALLPIIQQYFPQKQSKVFQDYAGLDRLVEVKNA